MAQATVAEHEEFQTFLSGMHHYKFDVHALANRRFSGISPSFQQQRYLRDNVKPDDTLYEYFLDDECTIPSAQSTVIHGNTCYLDHNDQNDSSSKIKMGCAVDRVTGTLYYHFLSYGNHSDCSEQPVNVLFAPMGADGNDDGGINVGDCLPANHANYLPGSSSTYMFMKVRCSAVKDELEQVPGVHILR